MRTLAIIILVIGIILGIYAVSMDTSVAVNYEGNSFGLPERVNNIGLMNRKQNTIIVAGVLSIIGTLILVFKKNEETESAVNTIPQKQSVTEIKKEDIKVSPIETLAKLKESGLISEEAFKEKIQALETLNEQDRKSRLIESIVNNKVQPLINLALKAKQDGLITEVECEAKKKELLEKSSKEVLIEYEKINKDLYNRLPSIKKDKVDMFFAGIKESEKIVHHHNKIKIINQIGWELVLKEGIEKNFEIIYESR
jgi:uncharacterized integral membrane protein